MMSAVRKQILHKIFCNMHQLISNQVRNQVIYDITNKVRIEILEKINVQVHEQLRNRVSVQLFEQLDNEFKKTLFINRNINYEFRKHTSFE